MVHTTDRRSPRGDFVRAYIPENLDLGKALPAKWTDYGQFVVGGLYLRRHIDRRYGKDDFVPLSSEVLKRYLPWHNYTDILNGLMSANIIEPRLNDRGQQTYRVGHESKSFRLAQGYREAPYRAVRLTHRHLVRKVRAEKAGHLARVTGVDVYRHLHENLVKVGVTSGWPTPSLALACIADGELFFTPCDQGRLHHNLSNLDRDLRAYVRWGGRKLYAIDVSNSQPLLLALTLGSGGELPTRDYLRYADWVSGREASPPPPSPPSLPPLPPNVVRSAGGDFRRMLDRCLAGAFYESLLPHLPGWDRSRVKDKFWVTAFGNPKKARWAEVTRAFMAEYPAVWAAIAEFYPRCRHGELARRMQTVESYLIVWRTCSRLMREFPAAPLVTLHDCLLTDEVHVGAFAEVLREEYQSVFGAGVVPTLSAKPF